MTTDEDNVQIEYVSAPLDLGTSEADEQQAQQDEEAEGMGFGLGLGFTKPKVRRFRGVQHFLHALQ